MVVKIVLKRVVQISFENTMFLQKLCFLLLPSGSPDALGFPGHNGAEPSPLVWSPATEV